MGDKGPHMCLVALVPWGQGIERNLQIVPRVIATWLPILKVTFPGRTDHGTLLHGPFVISLWPSMSSPFLLQVDAEPPVEVQKVWYLPREAIILSTHQKLAYIWPEGCDLPLLMPITPVVVYGYRALPSLPRDLSGKHPHLYCMMRNP